LGYLTLAAGAPRVSRESSSSLRSRTGDAGRGIPVRRAGAFLVTSAFGAEDGRGDPAAGPVSFEASARLKGSGYPRYFLESIVDAPEPPRSRRRPSGNRSSRELARSDPSFAWKPTTVTLVPAGTEFRSQPRRSRTDGEPPSIFHRSTVPSGFFTSMCSQECGLTHSIMTTWPSRVTTLLASNSAEKD